MPRNQSTAAQRARQAQRETGAKYTTALREHTRVDARPAPFTLRDLLTECTTMPEWTGEHPEVGAEWAPRMFDSVLLGGPVPYATVLLLTGGCVGQNEERLLATLENTRRLLAARMLMRSSSVLAPRNGDDVGVLASVSFGR
ncbi:hypothetical protein AQF52_8057 [Streptomyces venezuelae]|uniref:hypothetical protein n=1 Tax=Streptomyces gardneri TaxID=66892 RepID=UPI0006BC7B4E|nr:hypothetical protein [Streptomyces gardneri]ALO13638.1 hypothetical protein AQF52_8057 [Streptomyces venezuelae]QPK50218.1 hypothetical protein H4W23_40390 [Streptomyces gardneri]WRK41825.1 hypothetical protein U0M97_40645 [Streptomyces venezuelae]CUM35583.1 hypothetical protein BN2537_131 [Streptomyces venezuelae]